MVTGEGGEDKGENSWPPEPGRQSYSLLECWWLEPWLSLLVLEGGGGYLCLPYGENSLSLRRLAGFLLLLVELEEKPGMVPSA